MSKSCQIFRKCLCNRCRQFVNVVCPTSLCTNPFHSSFDFQLNRVKQCFHQNFPDQFVDNSLNVFSQVCAEFFQRQQRYWCGILIMVIQKTIFQRSVHIVSVIPPAHVHTLTHTYATQNTPRAHTHTCATQNTPRAHTHTLSSSFQIKLLASLSKLS